MSGITKYLIGGVIIGLTLLFAFIGLKSVFGDKTPETSTLSPMPMDFQANTPVIGSTVGDKLATVKDVPVETEEEKTKIELVNEPTHPNTPEENLPPKQEQLPASKPKPQNETEAPLPTKSPPESVEPTIPAENTPVAPVPPTEERPHTATPGILKGRLEIIVRAAEDGSPLSANVYVQQANGVQLDKSSYTQKAAFTLKADSYKITVRTEGRAPVSRIIKVPPNAVVSEIFPLPTLTNAQTTNTPPARPSMPIPEQQRPVHINEPTEAGQLRVVALAKEDGEPLRVNFTISYPDGRIIDSATNVSMAEFTVPAQEVIATFNYHGFKGQHILNIKPNANLTHTFNISGTKNTPPPDERAPPPLNN